MQCLLFDGCNADSRLIGVEFVISERMFKSLPESERKFWHSLSYQVKSGLLAVPGVTRDTETSLCAELISCYARTTQTWNTFVRGLFYRSVSFLRCSNPMCDIALRYLDSSLPLGAPVIIQSLTKDGQAHESYVQVWPWIVHY